jgi:hypothetical protein
MDAFVRGQEVRFGILVVRKVRLKTVCVSKWRTEF